MRRLFVLGAALVFIAGLGVLTVGEVSEYGFDGLSVFSLLIVLLLAVGVIGALRNPPR